MASRKLAAQSSSNASPAPLGDLERVIEIVPSLLPPHRGRLPGGRERENVQLPLLLQIDSSYARYY
jgi:hypothetical protein